MIQKRPYSAGGVSHSFWFTEFRRIIELRKENMSWDEIRGLVLDNNIFGVSSPRRTKQVYNIVSARIQCMDESFYQTFLNSEVSSQKILALIAAMAYDTLLAEFIYDVVRDKMIIGDNILTDAEVKTYFVIRQGQDKKIAKWTDQTLHRLQAYYKTMLREAGILMSKHGRYAILKPVLDPTVETWLKAYGMEYYLNAVEGVR